ncbi:MopE-related protein [Ekhidna sp.]|uniref:MopE-related protein n=1 Tax=Ekhidna sp. TaxID=2608089 RepID=UPI003C799416
MRTPLITLSILLHFFSCKDDDAKDPEEIVAFEDQDNDGFGNPDAEVSVIELTDGIVLDNTDCDDTDATIHPGATEIPDNDIDENCDGLKDLTWFEDADEDEFGNPEEMEIRDTAPSGYVDNGDDCDDTNADVNPDAEEIPDNDVDENCDDIKMYTWYEDADGDGFGNAESAEIASEQPTGYVDNDEDCDDDDELVNPDAVEIKGNDVDENCDGNMEAAICGDGVQDVGEMCDDGNTVSGDGCNSTCDSDETCGNGFLDGNEVCDDGNNIDGDGCNATCESIEICGDGIVNPGEECDDGNTVPGDGCDQLCQLEGEFVCDDGVDNDSDGNTDCDDPDCQGTTDCGGTTDCDGDGVPDDAEFPGCECNPRC